MVTLLLLLLLAVAGSASLVLRQDCRRRRIGAVGHGGDAGGRAGVGSVCRRGHFQRGERNERDA